MSQSQQSQSSDGNISPRNDGAAKTSKPSWVAPSFGVFDVKTSTATNCKKQPTKRQKRCQNQILLLSRKVELDAIAHTAQEHAKLAWVDKYAPKIRSDLAVHPRKIDDVYAWLETALKQRHKAPILVLSGPPGSGKTATIRVAAREMDFLLREWITPVNSNFFAEDFEGNKTFDSSYRSEYNLVKEFLLRASRFPSVLTGEHDVLKSVVLLEDLPITFHRDPGAFQDLLWEYTEVAHSPLVVIVGENKVFRKLFPESIISPLNIKVIEFNPVALTIITKLLQNIVQHESQNVTNKTFQGPTAEIICSIFESSCGDLRSAINTLQFACLRGASNTAKAVSGKTQGSPKKSKAKRPKLSANTNKEAELAAIGGRDAPDDFFRIIGRVLYAKREVEEGSQERQGALVHNPQDIVSSNASSSDILTSFLHENYLTHFGDNMDAVAKAADYLSLADVITHPGLFSDRDLAKPLGLSVSVRGLMYTHPDNAKSSSLGFRPHKRPRSIAAGTAYEQRKERASQLFPNSHCSSYELLTELVPYVAHIGASVCQTQAQLNFIESSKLTSRFGAMLPPAARVLSSACGNVPPNGQKSRSTVDEPQDDYSHLIEEVVDSD